jgi:hypothetical protein
MRVMSVMRSLVAVAALIAFAPAAALAQDAEVPPGEKKEPVSTPAPNVAEGPGAPAEPPEVKESVTQWGFGARFRLNILPAALLNLCCFDHSTSMTAWSVGAEIIRRNGTLDIVIGLQYEPVTPTNGLYQEKGENPGMFGEYPDFVEFNGFSMISADVSFIWNFPLASIVALRIGAGLGIGIPLGEIKSIDTVCPSTTTLSDLDNPNHCTQTAMFDLKQYPPVVPIVNLLLGFRFNLGDKFSLNIEGGWRLPSFYIGGGFGYFF